MANNHGGKRKGAGRPAGSGWRPKVSALRKETIQKMQEIVSGDTDPLTVVAGWIVDPNLDIQTRLSAASIALPFLYPRLSATTVDARVTTTTVDAGALMQRLGERLDRMLTEDKPTPLIETKPASEEKS